MHRIDQDLPFQSRKDGKLLPNSSSKINRHYPDRKKERQALTSNYSSVFVCVCVCGCSVTLLFHRVVIFLEIMTSPLLDVAVMAFLFGCNRESCRRFHIPWDQMFVGSRPLVVSQSGVEYKTALIILLNFLLMFDPR